MAYKLENASSTLFLYQRRKTIPVKVGRIEIGGDNAIRIQSMANTDTNDTEASVDQALRIEQAGGELVRFTAQGVKEASNLENIHAMLRQKGSDVPLVADIHFNPAAAFEAAKHVEKVRINPGNFVDRVHTQQRFDYTDAEYQAEVEKIKEKLYPLLDICKERGVAIRIGVNHGSLSDRILSRYGDTPQGMVESCMEFLRLCRDYGFFSIVISVKASNTVVMVHTVRLLVETMAKENMAFPLHLGVTEAGDGEDGRVKSALGIGALLQDGIGDTIRVSLSEPPENEIPVASALAQYVTSTAAVRTNPDEVVWCSSDKVNPFVYKRRETHSVGIIGGASVPVVVANGRGENNIADFCFDGSVLQGRNEVIPMLPVSDARADKHSSVRFVSADIHNYHQLKSLDFLKDTDVIVLDSYGYPTHRDGIGGQREFIHKMLNDGLKNPVVLRRRYEDSDLNDLRIKTAADFGQFLIDGLIDGIWVEAPNVPQAEVTSLMFTILQGARARFSKTEYISCPSCGRTLFDLQTTIARVKQATSHLKGLKIGVMGCVVNGPGEMADADYGYVGAGRGKVSLYKGQMCVEKSIEADRAVERLVELIKANGDWQEP